MVHFFPEIALALDMSQNQPESFPIFNLSFPKKGFVLVTTLWVLAILTMAASFFALWTQRTVETVQQMQDDLQGEIDMYNTQTNLIYLLATQPNSIAGLTVSQVEGKKIAPSTLEQLANDSRSLDEILDEFVEIQKRKQSQKHLKYVSMEGTYNILPKGGEIALDDRSYFGSGKAYFAIQDVGGLLNVNFASEFTYNRLFDLLGIDSELHSSLVAKLQDYVDIDDLHRLNGAERYHYEEHHLPIPRNHFLTTPMETHRILDWTAQSQLWENYQFEQLTQTLVSSRPNFNTAPPLVLQCAYNLNANAVKQIVEVRKNHPFYFLDAVTQVAGMSPHIDPMETNFFPALQLRLSLWYEGGQRMRQVYLRRTHDHDGHKPWLIEYSRELKLLPLYTQTPPIHAQTNIFNATLFTKAQ
jgi:hypothetical protein